MQPSERYAKLIKKLLYIRNAKFLNSNKNKSILCLNLGCQLPFKTNFSKTKIYTNKVIIHLNFRRIIQSHPGVFACKQF